MRIKLDHTVELAHHQVGKARRALVKHAGRMKRHRAAAVAARLRGYVIGHG